MFLTDYWYAGAFSDELGRMLLARKLLDQALILFRKEGGGPVALEDSCAHRRLPLSMGRIVGDAVECAYHGLVYDCSGACIAIPGQDRIPDGAAVRCYPTVERHKLIWVWMGDPALADEALIPDFHGLDDDGLELAKLHLRLKAYYQLHLDNLLDLSHIAFVHSTTTGNAAVVEQGRVETECGDDVVHVKRWQVDIPPPQTFAQFSGINDNVDMWQITEYRPPSYVWLSYGCRPTRGAAPEGDEIWSHGDWGFRVFQCITPETERTTHQFRLIQFDLGRATPELVETCCRQMDQISLEDAPVLAAQQVALDAGRDTTPLDLRSTIVTDSDAGPIHARRLVAALHDRQAARQSP